MGGLTRRTNTAAVLTPYRVPCVSLVILYCEFRKRLYVFEILAFLFKGILRFFGSLFSMDMFFQT